MAVALVNTASAASGVSSSPTTIVINKPTGTAVGDLLLANLGSNLGTGSPFTLAGWNIVPGYTAQSAGSNTLQNLLYRIADGTEGSTFTFAVASSHNAGNIAAYSGVDRNNPFAGIAETTATASTTATFPTATQQCESAYGVLCLIDGNTTASNTTPTAPSGYNLSAQVGSGQTRFIEAAIFDTHTAYGLPITAVVPGSSTLNNSSAKSMVTLFLRPDISGSTAPSIDVIVSSPLNSSATVTSPSFSTGYGELILARLSAYDGLVPAGTFTSVSGGSLTWTKATNINDGITSDLEIWWAYSSIALSGVTVSGTNSTATSTGIEVITFFGINTTTPIGATNTSSTSSGVATASLTTTGNNSFVTGMVLQSGTTALTPTAGNEMTINTKIGATSAPSMKGLQQTSVTASSGTSVTVGTTAPTASDVMAIVEILAPSTGAVTLPAPVNIRQAVNRASTF